MKKRICAGMLVCILCMGYLSMMNKIPNEVMLREGEELKIDSGIPLTYERVEAGEQETTLVSLMLNSNIPSLQESQEEKSYVLSCKILGIIPIKEVHVQEVPKRKVLPGGVPVGIYVKTDGILVIGTSPVNGADGISTEPAKYLLKSGDYIQTVNGERVNTKEELMSKINAYGAEKIVFGIKREGEETEVAVEPVMTGENAYKAGIWVRDDLAGVGTLTYTGRNGNYGALGHGVSDADTSTLIDMSSGLLYETNIIGIVKGVRGTPGELMGVINYSNQYCIGSVTQNEPTGVYGKIDDIPQGLEKEKEVEVGYKQEISVGKANIISTVDGERKEYEIEITGVNYNTREANKGIEFRVTDEELLEVTGGIVQGMSGSPIIQNGKWIGAVTHVFVQDPAKGYGIFAEKMLEE
ncbi:MAG: SpoIVB peptidase [Lachnospiraceae bacterium]